LIDRTHWNLLKGEPPALSFHLIFHETRWTCPALNPSSHFAVPAACGSFCQIGQGLPTLVLGIPNNACESSFVSDQSHWEEFSMELTGISITREVSTPCYKSTAGVLA